MTVLKRIRRWLRGTCEFPGCDEPRERWLSYCGEHYCQVMRRVAATEAERKFEYDVSVVQEGIRRAREQENA